MSNNKHDDDFLYSVNETNSDSVVLLFVYYDNVTFSIDYSYVVDYNFDVVNYGLIQDNVHGGWISVILDGNKTTITNGNQGLYNLSMVYVDINTGHFEYAYCNMSVSNINEVIVDIDCKSTVIDRNIGTNDYQLWVYPEIALLKSFNKFPVTTYFDIDAIKMIQCGNMFCDDFYVQNLSNGSFGYGRDSYMLWYEQLNLMYVSFLDYNGNGTEKKARLLIGNTTVH